MENRGGISASAFALEQLSDEALLGELGRVSRAHKLVTAELVAHIAEMDARKLYLVEASPSMFAYCVERLGCSEDEACRRIDAARVGRKWPVILGRIAAGEISLTVLSKLKPFLNDENVGELVNEVAGKSVREAERILASRFPKPDMADSIRKLPGPKRSKRHVMDAPGLPSSVNAGPMAEQIPTHTVGSSAVAQVGEPTGLHRTSEESGLDLEPRLSARPVVDRGRMLPLSAERVQVKFTASRGLEEKLELARDLMSHSNPRGDLATVIEAALDLLIAARLKTKLGQTKRGRKTARPAKKERITSATRREVLERDGLACTFVDGEGRRCGARAFLELDHVDPKGRGGSGKTEKVRLLCRGHNQLEAERAYGKAHMERKRREAQDAREPRGALEVREGRERRERTESVLKVRDGGVRARERFIAGFVSGDSVRGGADTRPRLAGRIRKRWCLELRARAM